MKHKNQLALAAWNLQALSDDYRVAAFLTAHDGGDIHAQVRALLERLTQGQNAQEQATALYDRLIDYLWHDSDDDSGEQGALELLSAVEILCRDILYGGDRACATPNRRWTTASTTSMKVRPAVTTTPTRPSSANCVNSVAALPKLPSAAKPHARRAAGGKACWHS